MKSNEGAHISILAPSLYHILSQCPLNKASLDGPTRSAFHCTISNRYFIKTRRLRKLSYLTSNCLALLAQQFLVVLIKWGGSEIK